MPRALLLENVELDSNGGNNGPEHNAYINASGVDPYFTFRVQGSWSHDAYYGHALKSRAQRTIVEGSYLSGSRAAPGTQTETYLLDVPDGGAAGEDQLCLRGLAACRNLHLGGMRHA